jgi:putative transposase
MARLLRVQFPGAIYHVTARGNERRLIFRDDTDRRRFLEKLAESKELYAVRLYLVCLMPNHFHLLLGTPGGNLSQCMGRLITRPVFSAVGGRQ